MEIHVLKKHIDVNRLEFLPYHFLLVSAVRHYVLFVVARAASLTVAGQHRLDQVPRHLHRFALLSMSASFALCFLCFSPPPEHIAYLFLLKRSFSLRSGELVAELRTKLGPCDVLTQNPHNAIILAGHNNGTVPWEKKKHSANVCFYGYEF